MKVHLERASFEHVQTFARELGAEDECEAQAAGYLSASLGCFAMLERAVEAWALLEASGRVLGMLAVQPGGRVWVHTAPAFKQAGLGALRLVRQLFAELLERHPRLEVEVDPRNDALVRLADWVGFRHAEFTSIDGRPFHHAVLRA